MNFFGFEIKKSAKEKESPIVSFADPVNDDGAINVGSALGGSYGMFLDMEGTAKSEGELITKYRSMSMQPELNQAVDEIVNEMVNIDSHENVVEINLDDVKVSAKLKLKIKEEFENILSLLDFSNQGYEIVQKWYIDGRINFHAIVDEENPNEGIRELRYLDPRKIRLIRENDDRLIDKRTGVPLKNVKKEYYMYSEGGFGSSKLGQTQSVTGFRIAKDSIVRVTSGLMNENNSLVLSHLHKAIKPLNQLRTLEDANVIYTLTRAPERRIFYIDVGNLPKAKAEQYLYDMMTRHKNKLQYDSVTGEMSDSRKFMTMTEDFWFPRREGSRSTEIETLPGASSLQDNDNLQYFQKKLYKSLSVPVSRLEPESMYSFGRVTEISRDEVKFSKFIRRLRARFSILFDRCLERQLILKNIIAPGEWKDIQDKVRYDFIMSNYFEELKQIEIQRERVSLLRDIEDNVGKYYSRSWVKKNILFMSEQEIEDMDSEIEKEKKTGEYDDFGGGSDDSEFGGGDSPEDAPENEKVPDQEAEESLQVKSR